MSYALRDLISESFLLPIFCGHQKKFLYQTQQSDDGSCEGVIRNVTWEREQHISISGLTFSTGRINIWDGESIKCVIISPVVVVVSN